MIEIKNVTKIFNNNLKVLDDLSLKIEDGQTLVIIGRSGCGKSVLLKHIIGLIRPDSGQVLIDGQDVTRMDENALNLVRKRVGMVFQGGALFDSLTVGENVGFRFIEHEKIPRQELLEKVEESLALVGLHGIGNLMPSELSGGMKKRVALAGVLAMQPEVIVMDEPTANLDPRATSEILHLLLRLNKEAGITLLLATHDVDMVPLFANRLYILSEGKVASEGTPKEIFSNTELIRNVNLRSPRITHLFEVLKKENGLNIDEQLPLTISEARKTIIDLLNQKTKPTADAEADKTAHPQ